MSSTRRIHFAVLAAVACTTIAVGQRVVRKAPTAEDWTAVAKLPDFTGVWEIGLGGGGGGGRAAQAAKGPAPATAGRAGRGGGGRAGGPSLTPAYAEKAKAQPATPP